MDIISDLKGEEIVGTFYKKELQKANQKEFRVKKAIKKKVMNSMLNGNATIVVLTVLLIKKQMSSINAQIFSQTESFSRRSES